MIGKTITSNGIYNASDDNTDAFAYVIVTVPSPNIIHKSIYENGSYYAEDDDAVGYDTIDVSVSYNNGSKTITSNGVYKASDDMLDGFAKVVVDLPQDLYDDFLISSNGQYHASNYGHSGFFGFRVYMSEIPDISDAKSLYYPGEYDFISNSNYAFKSVTVNVNNYADQYVADTLSVYYDGYVRDMPSIPQSAFSRHYALEYVEFSNYLVSVGTYAFQRCSNLSCVSFYFNQSETCTIGAFAFTYCTKLRTVIIDHSVNTPESLILRLPIASLGATDRRQFYGTPLYSSYSSAWGSIYIRPSSLVSVYQAASGWSYYSDRITAYVNGVI